MNGKDIYEYIWDDYKKMEKDTNIFLDKGKKVTELRGFLYHFQSISWIDVNKVDTKRADTYR